MKIEDLIVAANKKSEENIKKSMTAKNVKFTKIYDEINEINSFIESKCFQDDLLKIGNEIVYDLFIALVRNCESYYRESYKSIRSAIELTYCLYRFSYDKYSLILWKNGVIDMSFSNMNSTDESIYKLMSVIGINEEDKINTKQEKARELYRICSESVHGKYSFLQQNISSQQMYVESEFLKIVEVLSEALEIIKFIVKGCCKGNEC